MMSNNFIKGEIKMAGKLQRYSNPNVILMQDNSARDEYDIDAFIFKMNKILNLFSPDNELEKKLRARIIGLYSTDEYNHFLGNERELLRQSSYMVRLLKTNHHPVVYPDLDYFENEFRKINLLNDDEFDAKLNELAKNFFNAVNYSAKANYECASKNNIPLINPNNKKEKPYYRPEINKSL